MRRDYYNIMGKDILVRHNFMTVPRDADFCRLC
jgi:hypothetical protein